MQLTINTNLQSCRHVLFELMAAQPVTNHFCYDLFSFNVYDASNKLARHLHLISNIGLPKAMVKPLP